MVNTVYAVLHIPTADYVTLLHRPTEIALFEDTVAANKAISIMVGDTTFYWGLPRIYYGIGNTSLCEYELPPDVSEFEIIAMPIKLIRPEALSHVLKSPNILCRI